MPGEEAGATSLCCNIDHVPLSLLSSIACCMIQMEANWLLHSGCPEMESHICLRVKRTGLCLGAFNPSNSSLLGAGVVFASAILWHISRCFNLDGSVYDFRSIFPFYPTSSGDADGKLSMTIKMFALYIRRNDFTLSTYVLHDASLSVTSFPFPALDFIFLRPSFLSFYLVIWKHGWIERVHHPVKLIKIKMSTSRIPSLKVSSANCLYSASLSFISNTLLLIQDFVYCKSLL